LRRDCQGFFEEEESEETMLRKSTRDVSPEVDSFDLGTDNSATKGVNQPETLDTVTGKLKSICPSLFFSLSAWERDTLDSSTTLGADGCSSGFC
jgi:hypothetical protein